MAYSGISKAGSFFNTILYSGTGSTQNITGVGFQPDLVWNKTRNASEDHALVDSVRGVTKTLYPSDSAAEQTRAAGLTAFGTDGYTVGDGTYFGQNSRNYVSWNWKAGTSVSGTTTGSGTAKSYTGSVNTTSGVSIIAYTGNGTAGHTIPHHLGVAPKIVLVKRRGQGGQWVLGSTDLGFTKFLELDLTGAAQTSSVRFNDTNPSSTVFTVGGTADTNQDGTTIVAYSFAEKTGFSKFGNFIGNGSTDGTFVYCGFKPALIIAKAHSSSGNWFMYDSKRPGYNNVQQFLEADATAQEYTANANHSIDIVSNGFKFTGGSGSGTAGRQSIFLAWAEEPLVANVGGSIPATAR